MKQYYYVRTFFFELMLTNHKNDSWTCDPCVTSSQHIYKSTTVSTIVPRAIATSVVGSAIAIVVETAATAVVAKAVPTIARIKASPATLILIEPAVSVMMISPLVWHKVVKWFGKRIAHKTTHVGLILTRS